jgi:imidazolonepropionase-like amidohydrolase
VSQSGYRRALVIAASLIVVGASHAADLAVVGGHVYTAGPLGVIENGVVLIEDGRITAVGPADAIQIPDGVAVERAAIVIPGLIDARTLVGAAGMYNVAADQDADETTAANTAELRVRDSFNPHEPLIDYVRSYGVTTMQVTPGDLNPIAGQAAIVKPVLVRSDAHVLREPSAMVFNLGEKPKAVHGGQDRAPGTRMATAALIRQALLDTRHYSAEPAADRKADLKLEALARVLAGDMPAVFIAHREDDILTALRIAQEFELDLQLHYATEGYLMREALAAAGAPVILGPTMHRVGSPQTLNASLEIAALLDEAGVRIVFGTGQESYVPKTRVLLFELAVAVANGLTRERALEAATIDAARLLGVADRVGSLERGKDADLVLFDGDPFEYTTHVSMVIVDGVITDRGPR